MALDLLLGVLAGMAIGAAFAAALYWRGYDRGLTEGYWDGIEDAARARRSVRPLPALPNDAAAPTAPYTARDGGWSRN